MNRYRVINKVVSDDRHKYLNHTFDSELVLLDSENKGNFQTIFTIEELKEIEKQHKITIVDNDNWELEAVNEVDKVEELEE